MKRPESSVPAKGDRSVAANDDMAPRQPEKMELTAAEVRRHSKTHAFSAAFVEGTTLWMSWVHIRGRMDKESTDGGQDLVLMRQGGFPRTLMSGTGLSGAVFSPDGEPRLPE